MSQTAPQEKLFILLGEFKPRMCLLISVVGNFRTGSGCKVHHAQHCLSSPFCHRPGTCLAIGLVTPYRQGALFINQSAVRLLSRHFGSNALAVSLYAHSDLQSIFRR